MQRSERQENIIDTPMYLHPTRDWPSGVCDSGICERLGTRAPSETLMLHARSSTVQTPYGTVHTQRYRAALRSSGVPRSVQSNSRSHATISCLAAHVGHDTATYALYVSDTLGFLHLLLSPYSWVMTVITVSVVATPCSVCCCGGTAGH
jgi:hypothetical protein